MTSSYERLSIGLPLAVRGLGARAVHHWLTYRAIGRHAWGAPFRGAEYTLLSSSADTPAVPIVALEMPTPLPSSYEAGRAAHPAAPRRPELTLIAGELDEMTSDSEP